MSHSDRLPLWGVGEGGMRLISQGPAGREIWLFPEALIGQAAVRTDALNAFKRG